MTADPAPATGVKALADVAARGLELLQLSFVDTGLDRHDDERVRALHDLYVVADANAAGLLAMFPEERFLPPAWGCARAAALAACRSLWLGVQGSPDEAEARLVALIRETARRLETLAELPDPDAQKAFLAAKVELEDDASAREAALEGRVKIPRIPTDTDLTKLVSDKLHILYVMASQFAHATLMTRALSPGGPAEARALPGNAWGILIDLSWTSARASAAVVLNAAQLPVDSAMSDVDVAFDAAMKDIIANGP